MNKFKPNSNSRSRSNYKNNNNKHRINQYIRNISEVRLVGDNVDNKIHTLEKAKELSESLNLDLVEISPNANPPVCKIMDYKKFLFDEKKKLKDMKNSSKKIQIKEIKFGPNTEQNDVNYRTDQAISFLEKGNKVKASIFFKGRQIAFKERGEKLLLEFVQSLQDYGNAESMPKLNGKRMEIIIKPKSKSKSKS